MISLHNTASCSLTAPCGPTQMVGNKLLHSFFMDAGGLGSLRAWLEPFQRDRSLPNAKIRSTVLRLLQQLPIDLSDSRSRQLLRDAGIAKNVMFLYKLPEETAQNRRTAKVQGCCGVQIYWPSVWLSERLMLSGTTVLSLGLPW